MLSLLVQATHFQGFFSEAIETHRALILCVLLDALTSAVRPKKQKASFSLRNQVAGLESVRTSSFQDCDKVASSSTHSSFCRGQFSKEQEPFPHTGASHQGNCQQRGHGGKLAFLVWEGSFYDLIEWPYTTQSETNHVPMPKIYLDTYM